MLSSCTLGCLLLLSSAQTGGTFTNSPIISTQMVRLNPFFLKIYSIGSRNKWLTSPFKVIKAFFPAMLVENITLCCCVLPPFPHSHTAIPFYLNSRCSCFHIRIQNLKTTTSIAIIHCVGETDRKYHCSLHNTMSCTFCTEHTELHLRQQQFPCRRQRRILYLI